MSDEPKYDNNNRGIMRRVKDPRDGGAVFEGFCEVANENFDLSGWPAGDKKLRIEMTSKADKSVVELMLEPIGGDKYRGEVGTSIVTGEIGTQEKPSPTGWLSEGDKFLRVKFVEKANTAPLPDDDIPF